MATSYGIELDGLLHVWRWAGGALLLLGTRASPPPCALPLEGLGDELGICLVVEGDVLQAVVVVRCALGRQRRRCRRSDIGSAAAGALCLVWLDLELAKEEAIHVMYVWLSDGKHVTNYRQRLYSLFRSLQSRANAKTYKDALREIHLVVEDAPAEAAEAFAAKVDAGGHDADILALLERILHHLLVLLHQDRACAVHDIAARLAAYVD